MKSHAKNPDHRGVGKLFLVHLSRWVGAAVDKAAA